MKLKMILMLSVASLMMSACGHRYHKHCGSPCGGSEAKKECREGECSLEKKKACCGDKKEEAATPAPAAK